MTKRTSLLLVDDDRAMREMLRALFEDHGYEVCEAESTDSGLEQAANQEFDVVLSDIRMPGRSGIQLVSELHRLRPETPVVLMTAFGSMESAIEAMRVGAHDYITKPFESEAVLLTLQRVLETKALVQENKRLRRAVDKTSRLGELIGVSAAMQEIFAGIRRLAHNRSNVLITGESGTGKELVARALHFHGAAPDKPFVPINCTALPEGLLESELFGHMRGAFTGAVSSKTGLFKEADGGTIFLDEIGDMSLGLQAKLLRVIQDRQIRPVGSTQSFSVDVRIIAATNQNLVEAAEKRVFREDLYYRLNVIPIEIPPLRERREDVPPLISSFLVKHGSGEQRYLSDEAMRAACEHPWKGNAREVENVIERALAFSDSTEIGLRDLGFGAEEGDAELGSQAMLAQAARQHMSLHDLQELYMDQVLELTGGNKVQAAKILQIDRKTLYRRQLRNLKKAG
ncbi:MAG: sigma-54-dependent Fis family transcriptional regulator [bacterium]|nr:sigma-54-dependent Fis family transcriptional regulator [bacterium]